MQIRRAAFIRQSVFAPIPSLPKNAAGFFKARHELDVDANWIQKVLGNESGKFVKLAPRSAGGGIQMCQAQGAHKGFSKLKFKYVIVFSEIRNQYNQLRKEDIDIEPINPNEIPQLKEVQVWDLLTKIKINKSTVQGDISARIYK